MEYYLLFGGWKEKEAGAEAYYGCYMSLVAAREVGIAHWEGQDVRLASWMHLAVFDPQKHPAMKVIANLHIPGTWNTSTEWRVSEEMDDVLHWVVEDDE